ncbi:DUF4268 domain-containing protein [uncultured Luteimonas sp.]|uniref:DUF4268 domain-containing protein n=1 Tax=uncultured Luteimonas sp. TaxID=453144 RepID=UPI002607340F|nr:DUF4268 domain-containing protein [uncultured Luteimonas sp.]
MTHTLTAKEQPLAKIFSDEYMFSIPAYQRPYSWGVDQAQELLDDLIGYMRVGGAGLEDIPPYFLGSLVLIKSEVSPKAEVVDGQQRLTTLTLLLACIRAVTQSEEVRHGITACIYQKGNIVAATRNHYRLTLRERDMQFFRDRVQHEGGIEQLVAGKEALPDSQARLRDNARHFIAVLRDLDPPTLVRLVQFIVTRCYLVAVATPDLDSAYRIFGVMNSRGLDLTATDILKAEIIGAVNEASRKAYTQKWEELEADLGRDGFGELFSHIRMVYRKAKPQGTLLKEFREHVAPTDPATFVDQVLAPMAQAYREISDADHASTRNAEAINDALRWLNRLEFKDWMPPALAFFTRHKGDPDALLGFVTGLERLAYSMLVRKAGVNERIERFSRLTAAVEAGDDLAQPASALQLSPLEQHEMYTMLDGPLYRTHSARALGVILLRLDALASDGSKTMQHDQVTVEHVLPQTPRADSIWVKWMPSEQERQGWVHRLGNLALLNRKKNSSASNYDFDRKKHTYFSKGGACAFPLTTQVLQQAEWNGPVLQARQASLLKLAEDHWQLAARAAAAKPAVTATAAQAVSPMFVLGGLNHQLQATGRQVDGQFVVFAGSRARADWVGADGGYKFLHQDLVDNGTLAPPVGEAREFLRDTWFSSPSAAAAVVWGRSANGRMSWRVQDTGQTFAEWEEGVPAGESDEDEGEDDAREDLYRRFWDQFLAKANARGTLFQRRTRSSNPWLGVGMGRNGFRLNVAMTRGEARVTCLIHQEEGCTALFDVLHAQRAAIEAEFGAPLDWAALSERKRSRIRATTDGGWLVPEAEWSEVQGRLVELAYRLNDVLRPRIESL